MTLRALRWLVARWLRLPWRKPRPLHRYGVDWGKAHIILRSETVATANNELFASNAMYHRLVGRIRLQDPRYRLALAAPIEALHRARARP